MRTGEGHHRKAAVLELGHLEARTGLLQETKTETTCQYKATSTYASGLSLPLCIYVYIYIYRERARTPAGS